jgi:hypothetical protein
MRKTFIEVSRVGSFLKASKKRGGRKKTAPVHDILKVGSHDRISGTVGS